MVRWMMNHGNARFLDTFDDPMLGNLPYASPLLAFCETSEKGRVKKSGLLVSSFRLTKEKAYPLLGPKNLDLKRETFVSKDQISHDLKFTLYIIIS